MIEIICDQYGLYPDEDFDSVIFDSSQYESELEKIEGYAKEKQSYRAVVRSPVIYKWLDAAIKYGVTKRLITPANELVDQLGFQNIPDCLKQNQHWIGELDLIEKSKQVPAKGSSAEAWLKQILLGRTWTKTNPNSAEDLSDILNFLGHCEVGTVHPLRERLISDCLQNWCQLQFEFSELFFWLKDNPYERSKYLIWEQLLSNFPEDRIASWMQQNNIWYELSLFPNRNELPQLEVPIKIPEYIITFTRLFLKKEWEKSPEETLAYITGHLDYERHFLLEKLRQILNNEIPISDTLYHGLTKLKGFSDVIELAEKLHPKKCPSEISSDCSFNELQTWLEYEYLPFYNSCALLGRVEETLPYIQNFETWLEQHYTELLFGKGMAYQQLLKVKHLTKTGESVLMIVFDGLDYLSARDDLLPVMENNGLYPSNGIGPYLSVLPTQTYIAKPALVGGRLKSQLPDEIPNAKYYQQRLSEYIGISSENIRSKTDRDGTLLELIQEPAAVYLYLDNHLDQELLHRSYRQHLRQKKYSEYVKKKGIEIAECLKDFKELYGKSLKLVVSSDHGYTIIPKNTGTIDVPLKKTDKTRTVADIDLKGDADNEENIWTLNPDLYGLNVKMSIPKGYYCFQRKPLGATHGGCTPQEMAVPWFVFSEAKPETPQELSFSVEGEIFRKRSENQLNLKISNTNPYQIYITQLEMEGLTTYFNLPIVIGANSISVIKAQFDASSVVESYINFSIIYCFNGPTGSMNSELTITIPTTGAMATDFDDDFEF
ncbi:MAG: hypothetical protein ACQES9_12015 [Myxococcota bacterium]